MVSSDALFASVFVSVFTSAFAADLGVLGLFAFSVFSLHACFGAAVFEGVGALVEEAEDEEEEGEDVATDEDLLRTTASPSRAVSLS